MTSHQPISCPPLFQNLTSATLQISVVQYHGQAFFHFYVITKQQTELLVLIFLLTRRLSEFAIFFHLQFI